MTGCSIIDRIEYGSFMIYLIVVGVAAIRDFIPSISIVQYNSWANLINDSWIEWETIGEHRTNDNGLFIYIPLILTSNWHHHKKRQPDSPPTEETPTRPNAADIISVCHNNNSITPHIFRSQSHQVHLKMQTITNWK